MVKPEIQSVKLRFGIIGNTEELNRAIDVAMQVAPTDLSVLVTGKVVSVRKVFLRLFISSAVANTDRTLPLTVVLFRKEPLIPSCSAMKRALLPEPSATATVILPKPMAERSFWMK